MWKVVGGLIGIASFVGVMSINTTVTCKEGYEYVSAHRSDVPTTYAGISAYPAAYRRAALSALPPATRIPMWREQLARVLMAGVTPEDARVTLTPTQRAYVQTTVDRLDSGYYLNPVNRQHLPTVSDLQAALGDKRLVVLYGWLGPVARPSPLQRMQAVFWKNVHRIVPSGSLQADCCHKAEAEDWCYVFNYSGIPMVCTATCVAPEGYWDACGFLGMESCDGTCYFVPWTT